MLADSDRKEAPPLPGLVPVKRKHPGQWAATAVAAITVILVAISVFTNPGFEWPVVGKYLFDVRILDGLVKTLELTVIAMAIGLLLGTFFALMRLSQNRLLNVLSWLYIWFFRSIPPLVQLIFWYNFAALYQTIKLGIPFGPSLLEANTNSVISPFTAAILGLGLAQAAYTAEVIRGGILSVPRGQFQAARAIGMPSGLIMRRIILPQAMRVIIPPVGNEIISMIKNTSLVSVISFAELLYSAQLIYSRTYQTIPLLLVACIWYLVVVSVFTLGQSFVERRYRER